MTPDEHYERGIARIDAGDWDGGLPDLALAINRRGGPFGNERAEAVARATLRRRFLVDRVLADGLARHAAAVAGGDAEEIRKSAFGACLRFFFDQDLIEGCRFPAGEIEPELAARLQTRADERDGAGDRSWPAALQQLELACLLCLDHRLEAGREAFATLHRFDRPPVRVGLDAVERFLALLPSDESAWRSLEEEIEVSAWRVGGFTAWEAHRWGELEPLDARAFVDAGFDTREARAWRELGMDAATAEPWRELGLEPDAAGEWKERGFEPSMARHWRSSGAGAEIAQAWSDAAFTPDDHRQLARNVLYALDLEAALAWRSEGFDTEAVLSWLSSGVFDPHVAARHRERQETPDEVIHRLEAEEGPDLAAWRACGFVPVERASWKPLGLAPEEAQRWRSTGMAPTEAAPWVEAGIDPVVASGWHRSDADSACALEVARLGLSVAKGRPFLDPSVRSAWLDAGITLIDAVDWQRQGVAPAIAAQWRSVEFEPDAARALVRAGIAPELAREWRAAGAHAAHEISNWTRTGLAPGQGAIAIRMGIGPGRLSGLAEQMGAAEVAAWLASGAEVETIRAWSSSGASFAEAQELERAGITDPAYVRDCRRSFSHEAILTWAEAGFESRERSMLGWPEQGFDPSTARSWSRRFFGPRVARVLSKGGHRPENLVPIDHDDPNWLETLRSLAGRQLDEREGRELLARFANEGYLPEWTFERALPWLELGFDGAARGWDAHGFGPDEARRWITLGFTRPKHATSALAEDKTLDELEAEADSSDRE